MEIISERKELESWKKAVKARDEKKCIICGNTEKPNAHHIIPQEIEAYRTDIDNGITLCCNHHRFSRKISAHQNPLAFIVFLAKKRPEQLKKLMDIEERFLEKEFLL